MQNIHKTDFLLKNKSTCHIVHVHTLVEHSKQSPRYMLITYFIVVRENFMMIVKFLANFAKMRDSANIQGPRLLRRMVQAVTS